MKTNYLSTLALIATFFISSHSFAEGKDKDAENTNVKTTISINQPRDAASGLPTGKRQHKPVSITKPVDKASPLLATSPNGVPTRASGLPTGKRQHKPVTMTKKLDKSSPLSRSAYRKCPDGTMINPGEKCPEKAVRAGYRLCPDGTMISHGQKCPEKSTKSIQRR